MVDYVTKGSNLWTEHYSAVQADVPDPSDPSTQLNTGLIQTLEQADVLIMAGEASSHCVANSIRDISRDFGEDMMKKCVLLLDCMSPVPGFEQLADDFFADMTAKGMNTATTQTLKF
jgi:nicotinamidase-related amidase